MPKKSATRKIEAVGAPTEPVMADPVTAETLPESEPTVKVEYKFWNKARCPNCKSTDTEAYATNGPVQYRRCRAPICRRKFTVTGLPA